VLNFDGTIWLKRLLLIQGRGMILYSLLYLLQGIRGYIWPSDVCVEAAEAEEVEEVEAEEAEEEGAEEAEEVEAEEAEEEGAEEAEEVEAEEAVKRQYYLRERKPVDYQEY
jgi:hypothetical protein